LRRKRLPPLGDSSSRFERFEHYHYIYIYNDNLGIIKQNDDDDDDDNKKIENHIRISNCNYLIKVWMLRRAPHLKE
jgi:hypothetical protein